MEPKVAKKLELDDLMSANLKPTPSITHITVADTGTTYELKDGEWQETFKYRCMVCRVPNNYWWMYCQKHENQCDREMDEAADARA